VFREKTVSRRRKKSRDDREETPQGAEHAESQTSDIYVNGKRFGDLLIEAGVITAEDLTAALEVQRESGERLGEALVKLGMASETDIVDALAVAKNENELIVAMSDPLDLVAIDDLRVATRCDISIQVALGSDLEGAIQTAYRNATADQDLEEVIEGARVELGIGDSTGLEELSEQEILDWSRASIDAVSVRAKRGAS